MSAYLRDTIPGVQVLKNKIPKQWAMADIYCQLIPNNSNSEYFEVIPRLGAFEISYKGVVSIFPCFNELFSWSTQR